jgi:signal transduction histidine kinase
MALAEDASASLGFAPRVVFEGPVDTAVDREVAAELLATLSEALSNVARHAKAGHVEIRLVVDSEVVLRVIDDGVGVPSTPSDTGHGLINMAARAERLGGRFSLRPAQPRGTVIEWRVPGR